ncbi:MAG: N-acetylornithine carbamoyltransferase [Ignavibacteriales bacterium]|nr:N-acetylornithine carbamoyltransferase [Ignavibacteriales bacterium]
MKHFLKIEDFSSEQLDKLVVKANEFKKVRYQNILKNKTLITMFFNPSTRTKISFDLAITELGGHCVTLEPGKSSWGIEINEGAVMDSEAEEHLKDAIKVISRYADFVGIRCFPKFQDWEKERKDLILHNLAMWSEIPVVNMETISHPCQALAMLQTIKNKFKTFKKKKFVMSWAYHPKGLNTAVANSASVAASIVGMDVTIVNPPDYDLDPYFINLVKENCKVNDTEFSMTNNMDEAYEGADFIYIKSWGSLKQIGNFQPEIHNQYKNWKVDSNLMKKTNNAYISHCLPLRRNMLVTDEVLDSPNSLIYEEAENRLHVQKAILCELNNEWYRGK